LPSKSSGCDSAVATLSIAAAAYSRIGRWAPIRALDRMKRVAELYSELRAVEVELLGLELL
jgi:hypothetical protein